MIYGTKMFLTPLNGNKYHKTHKNTNLLSTQNILSHHMTIYTNIERHNIGFWTINGEKHIVCLEKLNFDVQRKDVPKGVYSKFFQ